MSGNPTSTLVKRVAIGTVLCLAPHPLAGKNPEFKDLICTRINDHRAHCCDEVVRQCWGQRGQDTNCVYDFNHSKEKGLTAS